VLGHLVHPVVEVSKLNAGAIGKGKDKVTNPLGVCACRPPPVQ
jgi:hypothetical protein